MPRKSIKNYQRRAMGLFANRRKPARRRGGLPASDRHARKGRGSARERAVGPVAPLRGALRSPSGRARALDRGKCDGDLDATDRAGAGVRAVVGRDRLPADDRAPCERAQARLLSGARGVPDRAAPLVLRRFGSRRRPLAGGLSHRRRRGSRPPPPLSRHGLARRGTAWEQDAATPFAPRCVKDVLEEDLFARRRDLLTTLDVVFMDTTSPRIKSGGRGRPDARASRFLQGPSAGLEPDDPRPARRWRRGPVPGL